MADFVSGMTAAGAGTSVRPVFGLLATASMTPLLLSFGMFNTTATACTYKLVAFTGGTAGTGQVERRSRRNGPVALATAFGLWTADATVTEDTGYRIVVGAGAGNGAIITIDEPGLEPDLGSTSGLGLVPVGTGQVCEVYFAWDE